MPTSAVIRVAHIVNSLDAGGMENGVINVSAGLGGRGFEFQVWCLEREGSFADRLPPEVPVRVLGKRGGFTPAVMTSLGSARRAFRPDLLHTHNFGPLIYASLARLRVPVLHGEHAQLNEGELRFKSLMLRRAFLRMADAVHTVSRSLTADLMRSQSSLRNVLSIVNGVDTERFTPANKESARAALGLPSDGLVMAIVGRFGPYKRHALMLEAFEMLARKRGDIRLVMVGGGGPLEKSIRERVEESGCRSRIHVAGLQSNMTLWYQAMDLLVVPSVNEGLSNAVLEAMACGIPAVCHSACGNAEVISDGVDGWLVNLENADQLAMSLAGLIEDPSQLREAGKLARNKVAAQFSIQAMLEQYASVYRKLADSR